MTSSVDIAPPAIADGDVAARAGAASLASCTSTDTVLLTLTVLFGGVFALLACTALFQYRLIHSTSGFAVVDSKGVPLVPSFSRTQRIVLLVLALLTVAATITVAVLFSVSAGGAGNAAPGTTARAGAIPAGSGAAIVAVNSHNAVRDAMNAGLRRLSWDAVRALHAPSLRLG